MTEPTLDDEIQSVAYDAVRLSHLLSCLLEEVFSDGRVAERNPHVSKYRVPEQSIADLHWLVEQMGRRARLLDDALLDQRNAEAGRKGA